MSKMGQFVFEMQEAAMYMNRSEFIGAFGEEFVDVYDEACDEFVCEPAGFEQQQYEEMLQQINDEIPF